MKKKKTNSASNCKTEECCGVKNATLLIARVILGGTFVYLGVWKLSNINMISSMFGAGSAEMPGLNLPAPVLMAWLAALGELIGGAMVLLGILTKVGAGILAFIMAVALGTAHADLFTSHEAFKGAQSALGFLAASLVLLGTGGGRFKVWPCNCKLS